MQNTDPQQGLHYLETQNYPEAIAFYRRSIQTNPNENSHYWYLGLAQLLQGEPTEAMETWNRIISGGSAAQYEAWRSQLLALLFQYTTGRETLGDWDSALPLRQCIHTLDPTDFNNLLALIWLYAELEVSHATLDRALSAAIELLRAKQYDNINNPRLVNLLAKLVSGNCVCAKSLPFFTACCAENLLHPQDATVLYISQRYAIAYSARGQQLSNIGEFDEAVFHFQKALELDANLPRLHYNLGMALFSQGNSREAAQHLQNVTATEPDYHTAGMILEAMDTPKARDILLTIYNKALRKNWKAAQYERMAKIARSLLSLQPHEADSYYHLALALYYDGIFASKPEAIAASEGYFKKALEFQSDREEARFRLATLPYMKQFAAKGYSVSADCFTIVMPIWEEQLKRFAHVPNLNVLEIGCFEGMASCWLLDNLLTHETARITCIDNFEGVVEKKKQDQTARESVEERFDGNIEKSGAAQKVKKLVGDSQELLRSLPLNAYHIIYIDGSHLASDVLQDAVLSWGLLKQNGVMIFDDYNFKFADHPQWNTRRGIDAFLTVFEDKIQIIERGERQIFIEKIAS